MTPAGNGKGCLKPSVNKDCIDHCLGVLVLKLFKLKTSCLFLITYFHLYIRVLLIFLSIMCL